MMMSHIGQSPILYEPAYSHKQHVQTRRGRNEAPVPRGLGHAAHYELTPTIQDALASVDRYSACISALPLPSAARIRIRAEARVKEAHHTTHIAGTALSLAQSTLILSGRTADLDPPLACLDQDDVQELRNVASTMATLDIRLARGVPATEVFIREIHRSLVGEVGDDRARPGEYRRLQNDVVNPVTREVICEPPPFADVPRLMSELVSWLRKSGDGHPLVVAGVAHLSMLDIHPFLDGNGRTARVLSQLLLHGRGVHVDLVPMSAHYDFDRDAYYRALQTGRTTGHHDMTAWLEYFLAGFAQQLALDALPLVLDAYCGRSAGSGAAA